MKHRNLRIAWSVAWGAVALVLIALWVWSYWRYAEVFCPIQKPYTVSLASFRGQFFWSVATVPTVPNWQIKIAPPSQYDDIDFANRYPNWAWTAPDSIRTLPLPTWLFVILSASVAAVSWLPWRFSLRTLLLTTTVIAIVLGIIAWLSR